MLPQVLSRDLGVKELDCALILFEGRHDTNVNAEVAAEWFSKVKAPKAHCLVRTLGPPANDRGTRKVSSLPSVLRSTNSGSVTSPLNLCAIAPPEMTIVICEP